MESQRGKLLKRAFYALLLSPVFINSIYMAILFSSVANIVFSVIAFIILIVLTLWWDEFVSVLVKQFPIIFEMELVPSGKFAELIARVEYCEENIKCILHQLENQPTKDVNAIQEKLKSIEDQLSDQKQVLDSPRRGKKTPRPQTPSRKGRNLTPKSPAVASFSFPSFTPGSLNEEERDILTKMQENLNTVKYSEAEIKLALAELKSMATDKRNLTYDNLNFATIVFLNALRLEYSPLPEGETKQYEASRNMFSKHYLPKRYRAILHIEVKRFNERNPDFEDPLRVYAPSTYTKKFRLFSKYIFKNMKKADEKEAKEWINQAIFLKDPALCQRYVEWETIFVTYRKRNPLKVAADETTASESESDGESLETTE